MKLTCPKHILILFLGGLGLSLFLAPTPSGLSQSNLDLIQVPFIVNETFSLDMTQSLTYQFSLVIDQVGSYARIRVQGGIIDGTTPMSLNIRVILDGIETNQTFRKSNGLQKQYTFHSSSEYIIQLAPPVRPMLNNLSTVHSLSLEMKFAFNQEPEGQGIIRQVLFEVFTPPLLTVSEIRPIYLIQEIFSWKLDIWSFGGYFANTTMIIPLVKPGLVNLDAKFEIQEIELDHWTFTIRQGDVELSIRDQPTLTGVLELDPFESCEVLISLNPHQVSETTVISVKLEIQGTLVPLEETEPFHSSSFNRLNEKRLLEGVVFVQLMIIFIPLLAFYRLRCPPYNFFLKEGKI